MPEKSTNKERLKEITARIEQGVKEVFTSGKYADYLRTMSRFTHYSTNNRILIYSQNPKASHVAGYQAWQNKFERHVVKGAKGITIIAPTPYKKKIEEERLDPDTKLPMLDENGDVITEEKEIKIPMFKPVTVFDISQTDGKPLPVLAETLVGNVQNYDVFIEAVKRSSPIPIVIEPMQENMDGYFSLSEQNIHLREGMSEVQTVCAAIHEITHAKLHNSDAEEQKSHKTEEIEAESVAYAVCAYYGIETDANSFGYIANYTQGKSIDDRKNSLDLIGRTADGIISDIDRHYTVIMQERSTEQEIVPETEPQKHLYLLDNSEYLHLQHGAEGYKYTIYDADSKKQLQNGIYPKPDEHFHTACMEICEMMDIGNESVIEAHIDEFNVLRAANTQDAVRPHRYYITPEALAHGSYPFQENSRIYETTTPQTYENTITAYGYIDYPQPLTTEELEEYKMIPADKAIGQEVSPDLPEPPEVILAPMPDPSVSLDVMHSYGYTDADMLPLSKDRALELAKRDVTIYMLYSDNSEAMVFDTEDIVNFDGLFGITREDWDAIKADTPVHDRDIVAKNRDHVVSYTSGNDSELPDFGKESPLKNAEMLLEDDYSMLDGRINNGKSALAEDKKPSVLEQLKAKENAPKAPKTPKKTKEHEL